MKVTYKKRWTIIDVDDLIHLAMGYEVRIVDEATYNEYLNNPLFGIGDDIDDDDDDDDIII